MTTADDTREVLRFPSLSDECLGVLIEQELAGDEEYCCPDCYWDSNDEGAHFHHATDCERCGGLRRIPVRTLEAVWDAAECQGWTVRELRKVVKGEVEKPVPLDGGQAECPRCQFRFRLSKSNHKEVR
jgi:hypothetical protein